MPLCVTVKVWPAIVTVPVRCAVAEFAAMVMLTVPLPVPLAPAVIVTKLVALLTAVHVHPDVVVTFTVPVPPAAVNCCPGGVMPKLHGDPIVKVNEFEAPPPGVGLNTLIAAVPCEAISVAGIVALN